MNIIIPAAGMGERFKGYYRPKPLISVLGEPMILCLLNSLKIVKENVHVVYNKELDKYNFTDIITKEINYKINFIPIKTTRGVLETVYIALNKINANMPTLLLDVDTFYDDILSVYDKDNCIFYTIDKGKPIFSYIKTKGDKVVEIKEKVKISDKANTGAYGFKSGTTLKKYCKKALLGKNLYISAIYDLMIKDNIYINSKKIKPYFVGTPEQLMIYCLKYKGKKKRICWDLDNTLVTYPTNNDYTTVKPIKHNIKLLRALKEKGHTIIIYSARRMKTHCGNIGTILKDIGQITFDTLKKFDIPYDEIYFGKPYADFYIDDLGVSTFNDIEKETGIYIDNIESRKCNKIEINENTIIKTTINEGEIFYYKNIPKQLQSIFPKSKINGNVLTLEKINGVSFNYLYTNHSLTTDMLDKLLETLNKIHTIGDTSMNIYSNYVNKMDSRMGYNYEQFNHSLVYTKIRNYLKKYENENRGKCGLIHGDPVFTNIFLTSDNDIKMIDMRGKVGNFVTIYGDIFYDYAKVYQSLCGYDSILNSTYINEIYENKLKNHFEQYIINNFGKNKLMDLMYIASSLLFSLIPLHDNDKCEQYFNLSKKMIYGKSI